MRHGAVFSPSSRVIPLVAMILISREEAIAHGLERKVELTALRLVLIALGTEAVDAWPVLAERLTTRNWITIALMYPAILLLLIGLYARAPKGTPGRSDFLTPMI